ncbi:MAG: pyrroline-5-carboxylate reductase, partial [Planctomycetes bacterium]|nr:pyrroline-5-carboxylate reductase [Planctomycetota bacterium]
MTAKSRGSNHPNLKIGFIGAGQMATALARGFIQAGIVDQSDVSACDVSSDAAKKFADQTKAVIKENTKQVLEASDVVVLAVKPQQMSDVLDSLKVIVT